MKCIILSAGCGKRLLPLTYTKPKALLEIKGQKVIDLILKSLPNKIDEVIIIVGYLGHKIEEYVLLAYPEKNIKIIYDDKPSGTFYSTKKVEPLLNEKESFLLLHADMVHSRETISEAIKYKLYISHTKVIMPLKYPSTEIKDNFIVKSKKQTKEELETGSTMHSCCCVLNKEILNLIPIKWGTEYDLIQTIIHHRGGK